MSKTHFSHDLFEQIGGTNWVTRPGYVAANTPTSAVSETSVDNSEQQVSLEQQEGVFDVSVEPDTQALGLHVNIESQIAPAVVVLGAGLESIWQNEQSQAWQLWQNITKALGWDEAQVVFFDTELMVTEDAIFSTMEEVIELGVEWVLTMDEEHEISEQLSEGVQVVAVPEFELMLSDPYAKQMFYHSVIPFSLRV
ncbi:MAG: hypothetical protein R3254_08965 [Thiomicrorhabdus sp.]|nr:hypothetical protein [Thiomicrorhabdus sp.]